MEHLPKEHTVPLSSQELDTIEKLKRYTGDGRYLFPSTRGKDWPISDVTLNAALRRMS
ncbi:MAG: hypothetical protein RMJ39_08275 [Deltaproteobacteria bacterium]|nr:hypothetical protein [Deltaproteobacteria bacterium]